MNLENIHIVYFLGIGGIGMSALARWFKHSNHSVSGYDRTPTTLTRELESEGIFIHYEDDIELIPKEVKSTEKDKILIVFTPAIPKDSSELNYFTTHGYIIKKRSQVLGLITKNRYTVAVAGTHGKTTTSSMIAHILYHSGKNCLAFLGGISQNQNSNLILNKSEEDIIVVAEADEYDRSFLALHPNISVLTSADADHLDIYGSKDALVNTMIAFLQQTNDDGLVVVNDKIQKHLEGYKFPEILTYSMQQGAAYAENIRVEDAAFVFDFIYENIIIKDLHLHLPGFHNVENAVAAILVAVKLGVGEPDIIEAIKDFKGIKRRFEYILKNKNIIFIDDYAHHPSEIEAFLKSVKALYPTKKITVIFQPHLFTRTRDFAHGFSESLSLADGVILLEIYPARELPIEGVNSQMLLNDIKSDFKILTTKEKLPDILEQHSLEVLATIGAGDIDKLVNPIKELLERRYHEN
ncbi:UDP-N-acetylmuramate--L-alanine ligase [soil metagenome]